MQIECCSCYELFERRVDYPDIIACPDCVPDPSQMDQSRCPKCGWDSESMLGCDDAPVVIQDAYQDYELGYCGGQHWTEVWTCPECGTEFRFDNGSV